MKMSRKAFIWDVEGLAEPSRVDIKTLFEQTGIAPDVRYCNFLSNYDQLPRGSIFAVGGGHSNAVSGYNQSSRAWGSVHDLVSRKEMHYFGSCAGSILAMKGTCVLADSTFSDPLCLDAFMPSISGISDMSSFNLNGMYACAPFPSLIPADVVPRAKKGIRFCRAAPVAYGQAGETGSILYVDSPAFFNTASSSGLFGYNVVAHYEGQLTFRDRWSSRLFQVESPAAIVAKRAEGNHGGVFLSGPHIEACVEGSKMQELCNDGIADRLPKLSEADSEQLNKSENKEWLRDRMVDEIKRSFAI
jgi:hypothetical protein